MTNKLKYLIALLLVLTLSLAACEKEDPNKGKLVVGEVQENLTVLGDISPGAIIPPKPESTIRRQICPIPPATEIQKND